MAEGHEMRHETRPFALSIRASHTSSGSLGASGVWNWLSQGR